MRLCRFTLNQNVYAFSKTSSSYQNYKPIDFTVSRIIQKQKKSPSFLFQHTKEVCHTIATLFEGIPQNESKNIHDLRTLMKSMHLSGFSSWKALRQTSFTIQNVLNKQLHEKKLRSMGNNLNSLLQALSSLNYELQSTSDNQFICLILYTINFRGLKMNTESLRTIEALSLHSPLFEKLLEERKDMEESMTRLVEESLVNQEDKLSNILIANIIKNGIYQNRWTVQFLNHLKTTLSSKQNLQMNFKGLLNAIKLNTVDIKSIQQDKWHLSQHLTKNQASNLLTQIRIVNILKQMDYDVKTDQCLFNYEVDYKIGNQFIVQFHGIHHYRTNTDRPIQTKKSHWKVMALRNRGYKVFIVPFYTWNRLQTTYQKKAWLIENLQNNLFLSQSI